MLRQIRNSMFIKSFCSLIGLYLLNISVDSTDRCLDHTPEDLLINNQESIIEIVVEKVLGYENAIKEYDEQDREQQNKKSNIKIDLTTHDIVDNITNQSIFETSRHKFSDYNSNSTSGFLKLDIPPPKI